MSRPIQAIKTAIRAGFWWKPQSDARNAEKGTKSLVEIQCPGVEEKLLMVKGKSVGWLELS
jgi:hypothetical protein